MRPINTLKHVIDLQNTVPAGTLSANPIVTTVENAVSTIASDCDVGSHVRTFFLNVQVINSTDAVGTIDNVYMYAYLNPGNNIAFADLPAVNEIGRSNQRKQVFHQEMAMMSPDQNGIPITLFKGVLKVPRKASRLGVDDRILIVVGTPTGGAEIDVCIQCVYKEIR